MRSGSFSMQRPPEKLLPVNLEGHSLRFSQPEHTRRTVCRHLRWQARRGGAGGQGVRPTL